MCFMVVFVVFFLPKIISYLPVYRLKQLVHTFFKKIIYLFILVLAALGLCCSRAFFNCGERELLFLAVRELLVAVASLVAEHRL